MSWPDRIIGLIAEIPSAITSIFTDGARKPSSRQKLSPTKKTVNKGKRKLQIEIVAYVKKSLLDHLQICIGSPPSLGHINFPNIVSATANRKAPTADVIDNLVGIKNVWCIRGNQVTKLEKELIQLCLLRKAVEDRYSACRLVGSRQYWANGHQPVSNRSADLSLTAK